MTKRSLLGAMLLVAMATQVSAQYKPAYQLFTGNGKRAGYSRLIRQLSDCQVVFFGELHDNPIAHWLELEITKDLFSKKQLILGAEMFETDNQKALDDYLSGKSTRGGLDSSARLWKNYSTDYAPLVDFARTHHLPFVATNIPRRYPSMVAKSGFDALDTLPVEQKQWIAPLPIAYDPDLPCYKNMLEMMKGHGGGINLPKAQAIKDATMAWSINKYQTHDALFIHYNGSYHSENGEGILWYLNKLRPGIRTGTIAVVSQAQLKRLEKEHWGKAQFIVVVDEDMTTTY